MDTASFLAGLEPLKHDDRVRRVVSLGRDAAAGDAGARAIVAALSASAQPYERLLALLSVYGTEDGARVVAALSDPSRTVRRRAARMVARFCDDAQAVAALDAIRERRLLRRTVAALARRKRAAVVDAFLSARMKQGRDPTIVDLLPFGSASLVSAHLCDIDEAGDRSCLDRFADRHPAVAGRWLQASLERSQALDARQRHRLMSLITPLARRDPDTALRLVRSLFQLGEPPSSLARALRVLVRARPRDTFDLLKARHESGRPAPPPGAFEVARFDHVAPALGAERLDYLIRHAWAALGDGKRGVRWFLRLSPDDQRAVLRAFLSGGRGGFGAFLFRYVKAESPEEVAARERAFERWSCAARRSDGTIQPEVLDFLPRDLREREARRHLDDCPALAAKPARRITYARLLGFAEAKAVLAPFLGHPEGEVRASAQRLLVATVLHDRGALTEALSNVRGRKFEQDPVRRAMIEALAALPVARFGPEHLEDVGAVVQDALDAADLSHDTASAVEKLVVRLFRVDGAWGARWLARLLAVRGSVSTLGLGDGLTRDEAARLAPALTQLADLWCTKERAAAVIWLAQSLGKRLTVVPSVLRALERLARELPFAGVAARALGLLHAHDRPRFGRLVPELLREDKSFVLIGTVARYVSLKRQDLLDPLLESRPMTGRFATGRTHWVINFEAGHGRWTARQQERYAAGLRALLADETSDVPTIRFAISTLVRLAYADASAITPFASDPRPPVREMAIRGLPWLDAGQGVPVLLECLGDDRARWAIYALRKAFAEMRREQVLAELRAVPTTKVTVAKEVVRLLGEVGGDDAYRELLRMDTPKTHRDVRIALLRALWDHLERPETWDIFERAARDPDWIVASKLADIPLGRLSPEAEARVVDLLATILARPEPEARRDLLRRAAYLPLRDEQRSLFRRLLAHLGTPAPDEAAEALSAVLARMQPREEIEAVVERIKELLPNRRHLVALLSVLSARLGPYAPSYHVAVGQGVLAALKADALAVPRYLELAALLLDWKGLAEAFSELAELDLLHHDAMVAAMNAVRRCVHPALLEERLRESRDPRLRRLALAALEQAAAKNGWSKAQRALLEVYWRDPSPAVAGPASFIVPP